MYQSRYTVYIVEIRAEHMMCSTCGFDVTRMACHTCEYCHDCGCTCYDAGMDTDGHEEDSW